MPARWRTTIKRSEPVSGADDPAAVLRKILWAPLEEYLQGVSTVLISPDGALGRFPFVALPGKEKGKYLIEEMGIALLPVPRLLPDLLGPPEQKTLEPSLLLVGDVDYDAAEANKVEIQVASLSAPHTQRDGTLLNWKALSGTRVEVVAIRDSFAQRFTESEAKLLRKDEATEAALRDLAGKHRFLHVATHGFFAPAALRSPLAPDPKGRQGMSAAGGDHFGSRGVIGFHPGLLSGLVLAGANRKPEPGKNDGILTALEVADLDLRAVELAVLSACETGLGETAGGEGLLGLQRAFQVAGARTTVASLWQVPDKATEVLMTRFYDNFWRKKMSKLQALREAQLWMLREVPQQPEVLRGLQRGGLEIVTDEPLTGVPPYYWAAFVLSGDWR